MATLEKTINGQSYTADSLKAKLIELGVSEKKFNNRESFSMPKTGTFTGFEVTEIKDEAGNIRKDDEGNDMKNLRITFKSSEGEGSISLTRLLAYGKVKENANHSLQNSDIKLSRNTKKYYIAGETLNPSIPSSAEKAILELVGKKFKCDEVSLFTLPFGFEAESPENAIDNVQISKGFKVSLI